jgi:hypothetical protein
MPVEMKPTGLVAVNPIDMTRDDSPESYPIKREPTMQFDDTLLPDHFPPTPRSAATGSLADFRGTPISARELEESEMTRKVRT